MDLTFQIPMQYWSLQHQTLLISPVPSTTGCCFCFGMRNTGLEEAQAGLKIAGRNINNLRYADDTTFMAESEIELEPLDESERGEWKWLKAQHSENKDHGIWSHHFMADSWGNSGNHVRFYFLRLQNHCRW